MRKILFAMVLIFGFASLGYADKQIKKATEDPVKKYKEEFLSKYGFFVTSDKPVLYYMDALGIVGKENEIFKGLKTIEDVDKFIEVFRKVRDTDPSTPENEFMDLIDQRLQDIKDEIFATDPDIPGVRFDSNGGLKGDMAHVYLLYGAPGPQAKAKLSEGRTHVELMVWYYFSPSGKPLFRFLFYNNYGYMHLFKKHSVVLNFESMMDPAFSPLKELSIRAVSAPQELYEIWQELEQEDQDWLFRAALFEFSYYSDIHIWDALKAPEPASLTALRFKPTILGQPGDLTGRNFINSSYNSFIPAILRMAIDKQTGAYTTYLLFKYTDLDWELTGDNVAECLLTVRMSFQNKTTRELKEFLTGIRLSPGKEYLEKNNMTPKEFIEKNKDSYFAVHLIGLSNVFGGSLQGTLASLFKELKPGTYVVNVDLRHDVTKKSAGGWREEIVIK